MVLLNKFRKEGSKKGLEREVIDNLVALLNTKQGYGAWQRGLGLGSYANVNSSAGVIEKIISDIEYNISQFEKRIHLLAIKLIGSDNSSYVKFQIECKIGGKFHSFYIGFTNYPEPIFIEEDGHG